MHSVYTLNIGLKPSDYTTRAEYITREEVLAALRGAGYRVLAFHYAQSETELTAVVTITGGRFPLPLAHGLYNVSLALAQDCIAVQDSDGVGLLIGPRAEAWGEFNPDYFITEAQAENMAYKRLPAGEKVAA